MGIRSLALAASAVLSTAAWSQLAPPPDASNWTFIGPASTQWASEYLRTSGRIRSLAFDGTGTLYIAAEGGGIWKSAGAAWIPLTDAAPTLAAAAVAVAPSNPRIVYAGTGSYGGPVGYYGMGILKSTDGGSTWTHIAGPFMHPPRNAFSLDLGTADGGSRIISIAVSPTDPDVVLAGVLAHGDTGRDAGIYRSTDGGFHWSLVQADGVPRELRFHPTDGNVAYAALGAALTFSERGVYRSTDGGAHWARLPVTDADFTSDRIGTVAFAIAPSDPRILYAAISDTGSADPSRASLLLGFWKSVDGGDNWTRVPISGPDFCAGACIDFLTLAVHPSDPNTIAAGGEGESGVRVSTDGGTTWTDLTHTDALVGLHPDISEVAFSSDGSTLYAAGDGGIASTTAYHDPSPAWTHLDANLGIAQVLPGFDVDPSRVDYAFIRTQDNGTQHFDGHLDWTAINGVEGGYVAYDAAADIAYSSGNVMTFVPGSGTYITSVTVAGIPDGEPFGYPVPFAIDRSDTAIQYTAGNRVFRTVDRQANWAPISPVLTSFGTITDLAVGVHDHRIVCASTEDGHVWCTDDATAESPVWTDRSAGLPSRVVTHVAIDRFKDYEMAATVSGFDDAAGGHVFLSIDSGATWTDVSGNLPDAPVNSILFDEDVDRMFVASDEGVFRTLDGGATWAPVARGLPKAHPNDLLMHEATRTLFVSTPGRGIWRLSAAPVTSTPPPAITMSPWLMRFSAHFGGPNPASQSLSVMNAGSPLWGSTPLHWTATASTAFAGPWLSATPGSGTDAAPVAVSADVTGLGIGTYNGTVRIDDPASSNGPQDLLVLLDVTDTAPAAAAGADTTVDATSPAGAAVLLDGTQSSDADGDPLSYLWTGAFGKATGATAKVQMPIGATLVTLTVADPAGLSSSDTVKVTVNGANAQAAALIEALHAIQSTAPGPASQGALTALLATLGRAVAAEGTPPFCNLLNAFVHQVDAFAGHALGAAEAASLAAKAKQVAAVAGCR